jgi:predicted transposase YbfD/YdcC
MATSSTLSQLPNTTNSSLAIKTHFRALKDPRRRHRRLHRLLDIVTIAICAVICGANDWQEVATFGRRRRDWLKRFLALPNGIPSHDTFERVFDRIDPQAFQACFRQWITAVVDCLGLGHVAIDGKTLRRSGSATLGPLHLVSAWATANHLALAAVAVPEKTNEITAIPQLLELLDLHGALVTIDAMGCQKEIARRIIAAGADYTLTVKDNQEHLLEDIQRCFVDAADRDMAGVEHDTFSSEDRGHGRHEKRTYTIIRRPQGIRNLDAWAKLCVIGMCYSERTVNGVTSEEARYFIGSKLASARYYGKALRHHWGIENGLHWQMDLTFKEDSSRIRKRRGGENFGLLRRLALSLLKQHPEKSSIACKRLGAALDSAFLEEVLRGGGSSGND